MILIELLHSVKLWFITQFKPKSVRVRQLKWLHAVFPVICSAGAIICQSRKECVYMVAQANCMPALILEVVIFNGFGTHVWFQAPLLTVFDFRVICWNPTHWDVFPFKTSCKHVRLIACEASLNYHNTRCFTLMHAEGRNGAAFILVYFYIVVSWFELNAHLLYVCWIRKISFSSLNSKLEWLYRLFPPLQRIITFPGSWTIIGYHSLILSMCT